MRIFTAVPPLPAVWARLYTRAWRALAWTAVYAAWVAGFRLLMLTLVTYFLASSSGRPPRLQEITDAFGANELTLLGLGAALFVALVRGLNPITTTTSREIFTPERFEKRFLPGFLQGSLLALGVVLAFLISGIYRYLGVFIQYDEAPMAIASILVRIAALGALAYCEELIFRRKIQRHLSMDGEPGFVGGLLVAGVTAVLYCSIKWLQLDLGWMQLLTLALLSVALSMRALADRDFARGAGFWAALLVVFQPLLSLPVLGNEFSGVVLVKYQGGLDDTTRVLTGGAGGPLSSLAFQLVLLLDVARGCLRYKKSLPNPSPKQLK